MDAPALSPAATPAPDTRLATPAPDASKEKLRKAAQEFEGMVIGQMLAPMFEGLTTDGLGGGGAGEAMFRPMLVQRYADSLAKSGGIGLANNVMAELVRLQEGGATHGADR